MIQEQINTAIDASVEALNNIRPNWLDSMPPDVQCIDVMDADACPLYYAFGDFWTGWEAMHHGGYQPVQLAFATLAVWEDWNDDALSYGQSLLREAWRKRIAELRGDQS